MLFNIEQDDGDRLVAYVVPDGYSAIPRVRLVSGGEEVFACAANEKREALVVAGRHETGMCGFNIGVALVPGLRDMHDLCIVEDESGVLVYRRPQANKIQKKVLRLETHLFPLWKCDDALGVHFQYFERALEKRGRETVTQMFLLNGADSVYLSGRILYKNFATYIDHGFEVFTVIQDPYEELAERLLVLSMMGDVGDQHLGDRDATRFIPAIDYASKLALNDPKVLRRALLEMPDEVSTLLADPLVRQLTTATPDEMPTGSAVASALDILSTCAFVGLRQDPHYFGSALAAWLGVDQTDWPDMPNFPRVAVLANELKESRTVDHLIARDVEVFEHFKNAYLAA